MGVTILKILESEVALSSDRHGQDLPVGAGHGAQIDAAGLSRSETAVGVATERDRWKE